MVMVVADNEHATTDAGNDGNRIQSVAATVVGNDHTLYRSFAPLLVPLPLTFLLLLLLRLVFVASSLPLLTFARAIAVAAVVGFFRSIDPVACNDDDDDDDEFGSRVTVMVRRVIFGRSIQHRGNGTAPLGLTCASLRRAPPSSVITVLRALGWLCCSLISMIQPSYHTITPPVLL